jgi:ABC-2 type transport system ATP-binding protein
MSDRHGPETVVQARGLVKRYREIHAVDGIDLTVPAGDVYGLLGPNGAGKTTFMRMLFGLVRPDAGTIELFGRREVTGPVDALRDVAGFVETPRFYPYLSGRANLEVLATPDRRDAGARIDEVLDQVELAERSHSKVREYSYGMVQRLGVAAALMRSPRLLILDEPTNGMDPAGRLEMIELARDLSHGKGMSLIFSSHLLPDVEAVCDHVLVLGRGALLAQGNIQEMKQAHPRSFDVRLKGEVELFLARLRAAGVAAEARDEVLRVQLPEGQTTDLLWRIAAELGEQIRHLRPHRSSLEDVFLEAVAE